MGRAYTYTLMPIDRWAAVIGLEPRHFNGLTAPAFPVHACKQAWLQYAWQSADRVCREEVAQVIAQAEEDITALLGYSPLPKWEANELHPTTRPLKPHTFGGIYLDNVRGLYQSVKTDLGDVISGGVRHDDAVQAAAAVVWQDPDLDGYFETARVQVVGVTMIDINEVRVYFPGEGGNDEWEIRPLRSVTIAAGTLTILIDRHLLVDPNHWESLAAAAVDGTVNANFVATVDVYRVWNDPSQQLMMMWERYPGQCDCGSSTCAMCAWAVQWGCLQGSDPKSGFVTYQPGDWDATTETYTPTTLAVARQPERVRLWYYAGHRSNRVRRPYVEMDPFYERMIVMLSITLLDRNLCSCNNITSIVERWKEDRALQDQEGASYQLHNRDLTCPWGTRSGALEAYRRLEPLSRKGGVAY